MKRGINMTETPVQFTQEIIAQMNECSKRFYNTNRAGFLDYKTTYINQIETFDNIRIHYANVCFNNFIIRFCYYPHVPLTTSHSALTCFVSLEKSETERFYYPLSQIYEYFGICPENALTIPLILSPESMKECFCHLTEAVKTIMPKIQSLSYYPEQKTLLFNQEIESAILMLKKEYPSAEDLQNFFHNIGKDGFESWKAEQSPTASEDEMKQEFEIVISRLSDNVHSVIEQDKKDFLIYYSNLT